MALEIECKFLDVDLAALRQKMQDAGSIIAFQTTGIHWERNQLWDRSDKSLRAARQVLRLRQRFWLDSTETILTFKQAPLTPAPGLEECVKIREEYEVVCSDAETLRTILSGLGYQSEFGYEKIREVWYGGGVEIVLDSLVWGDIVEIEGTAEAIDRVAAVLALDQKPRTILSYAKLHAAWRQQQGLEPQESFYFPEAMRESMGRRISRRLADSGGH